MANGFAGEAARGGSEAMESDRKESTESKT